MFLRSIIKCADNHDIVSMAYNPNHWVHVTGRVVNQAIKDNLVSVGGGRLYANDDIIMLVTHLNNAGNKVKDVLCVISDRHNDSHLDFSGPCDVKDDDLEKIIPILHADPKKYPITQILDGFIGAAPVYDDQVAIPNKHSPSGQTGWIISKNELQELLDSLKPNIPAPLPDTTIIPAISIATLKSDAKKASRKVVTAQRAVQKALDKLAEAKANEKMALEAVNSFEQFAS